MTKDNTSDFKKGLEAMRENLQLMVEAQASQALLLKARFDALVKVGFSEEQAMDIVKARGIAL